MMIVNTQCIVTVKTKDQYQDNKTEKLRKKRDDIPVLTRLRAYALLFVYVTVDFAIA